MMSAGEEEERVQKGKPMRVAIVGGGNRCYEFLEMATLEELNIEIVGVADLNQDAPGIISSREKKIYITNDYKDFYALEGLSVIIELTGEQSIYNELTQSKPDDIQIVGHRGAHLFLDVIARERKTTDNYIKFIEDSPIGIYTCQNREINFVNKKFSEIFGYTKGEAIGMNALNLIHPKDREAAKEVWWSKAELKKEELPLYYECRGLTRDNRVIWVNKRVATTEYAKTPELLIYINNITERKELEETLKESREKYKRIFEKSKDFFYLSDIEGRFIDVNEAGTTIFGYSREELLKLDIARDLYADPEDRKKFREAIERDGFVADYETQLKKSDGTIVYVSITANTRKDRDGKVSGYEGVIRDITRRKKAEEKISRLYKKTMELAFKDDLTDIFNHRRINEILIYETKRAKRRADVFSIMILDVDNLKEINDTYGHIVGDKALKHIASLVKGSLRDGDSVGRYGGDEFLVILPNTPRNGALTMAERIHEKLRTKLFALTGKDFVSTFLSIGVATYPFDSINEKGLIAAADKEMYSAKRCSKK